MMSRISSGSAPSTAISIPLRKKASSIWRASSSRARSPWRLAFSAKETTTATDASGDVTLVVRALFRIVGSVLASLMSMPAVAAPTVPPKVSSIDEGAQERGRVAAVHDHADHQGEKGHPYPDKAGWVHGLALRRVG